MKSRINAKPLIAGLILIMSVLLLSSCGRTWESAKEEVPDLHGNVDAKTDLYESEKALDEWAGLIVRVEKTGNAENVTEQLDGNGHYHGWTLSKVKVKEVLKNNSEMNVVDGDEIPVYEQQFTYYDKDKKANITWHINQYNMMQEGNEYILYLNYSLNDKWYYMAGGIFGKINIKADEPVLFEAKNINIPEGTTMDNDSYIIALLTKLREECLKIYN